MTWWGYDDDEFYEYDDNTLSDYDRPAEAIVIEGPIRAESKRGDIGREWWGQQWVQAMEHMGLTGRLGRGKRYARNGSVLSLEISHGIVYAEVKGSRRTPYRTSIYLKTLEDEQWQEALDALSEQAIYAAKLLNGEMPGDIEAVFQSVGLSLFPENKRSIDFVCSCPDWGDPCKHAAAVYYLVAEQLDEDPFILFHLRGRTRDAVLEKLRGTASALDEDDIEEEEEIAPLDADLEQFWSGDASALIRRQPIAMQEPFALRQLGDPPTMRRRLITTIYQTISAESRRWLGLE
ncbi:MAG: SWIM zinc finger family protein [Anaerolineae bacterium]|nr:SWIM zinc finger family protein [Anaerolineae bacterium]MDQ7033288.1 SWIM zinc finger family protein [Anaerolineae bacterium]